MVSNGFSMTQHKFLSIKQKVWNQSNYETYLWRQIAQIFLNSMTSVSRLCVATWMLIYRGKMEKQITKTSDILECKDGIFHVMDN